jgi:diguanylate cyclase (GGDEF)-like protein
MRVKNDLRWERSPEAAERARASAAPAVSIVVGLALAGRAIAFPSSVPASLELPLLVVRVALSLCLPAWGLLYRDISRREASRREASRRETMPAATSSPGLPRPRAWISGDARSVTLLAWSTALSIADVLAGSGPAVFVFGAAFAAAIGWDRMRRFVALAVSGSVLIALASAASSVLGTGLFRPGDLFVAAAAAAAAVAVARTVKSYVAPGRERLLSLERENKQLWDLSFRDSLTGLYNRRFAQETGRILVSRARRYHEQLHVFMLDIDHFKRVNDLVSHAVGDEVLKGVAQAIQSCLRTSDSVARYGGEEFLAFVVQAEAEVAQFIANRIRETVASRKFESVPWQVTVSIGVASAAGDADLDKLVDRADEYLYASKRGGRNRVSGF